MTENIPTREEAFELLKQYNQTESLIKHALAVEGVMRYMARKRGEALRIALSAAGHQVAHQLRAGAGAIRLPQRAGAHRARHDEEHRRPGGAEHGIDCKHFSWKGGCRAHRRPARCRH